MNKVNWEEIGNRLKPMVPEMRDYFSSISGFQLRSCVFVGDRPPRIAVLGYQDTSKGDPFPEAFYKAAEIFELEARVIGSSQGYQYLEKKIISFDDMHQEADFGQNSIMRYEHYHLSPREDTGKRLADFYWPGHTIQDKKEGKV